MTLELRFRGFGGAWQEKKVEDIYLFIWTNSLSRENLSNEAAGYKNIHYGDIHTKYGQRIDTTDENTTIPYIKSGPKVIIDKFLPTSILKEKDIVMADASEDYKDIGKSIEIIRTEGKTVAGLHTIVLRPYADSIASSFGTYLFNSPQVHKQIARLATGVSVLGISKSNLSKLSLKLPSIEEQEKIAGFLGVVDDKISGLEKKKDLLEKYKKGVMQKIFTQQIRFKGLSGKWEEKKLGEVGKIIGGGTPDTSNPKYWNGDIYWLTPTEVKNKYINSSLRKITELGLKNSSAKLLPVGTIIFTSRATVGEVAIAKVPIVTNQGFQSIVVNKENNNKFIYYWAKMNKKEFLRKSNGSTFLEISGQEMKKIKILLPSLEEQQRIANFLTAIDDKIELTKKELEQAKNWKKGLLQQMFV